MYVNIPAEHFGHGYAGLQSTLTSPTHNPVETIPSGHEVGQQKYEEPRCVAYMAATASAATARFHSAMSSNAPRKAYIYGLSTCAPMENVAETG